LRSRLADYNLSEKEFIEIPVSDSLKLNAYIIKPADFDAGKKYPVLMFTYGGPGSQEVKNEWDVYDQFWYQMLAQKGFIVVCVDNRGTAGRGKAFKHSTYGQLGKYESEDQINSARYLGKLPYVDASRIGIWGWSYGGYLSSVCLLLDPEVFKMAMAVAPVINWRFYDTIYTERFLKTPQENPGGYDNFSPLTHASKLKRPYLLVHGTGDDNVHVQNSIEMQNALIRSNKQFQAFYYPNRNHGIYGGVTRLHLYQMMTDFVLKNL